MATATAVATVIEAYHPSVNPTQRYRPLVPPIEIYLDSPAKVRAATARFYEFQKALAELGENTVHPPTVAEAESIQSANMWVLVDAVSLMARDEASCWRTIDFRPGPSQGVPMGCNWSRELRERFGKIR